MQALHIHSVTASRDQSSNHVGHALWAGRGIAKDVVVSDVSTMGCKFYDRISDLVQDSRLTIRVGNIGPLDAVVRWRTGQLVVVKFDAALHESVIEHLAIRRQTYDTTPP